MDIFKSRQIIQRISRPTKININICDLRLKTSKTLITNDSGMEVNHVLELQKKKLDNIDKNVWMNVSFLSNPFEYIHPKITKYCKQEKITSNSKPISRAYYKMWEIMNAFPIFNNTLDDTNFLYGEEYQNSDNNQNCVTAHLAEGPGGFIQAVMHRRHQYTDRMYAITIQCSNKNKLFNQVDNRVNIQYGNITHADSIEQFATNFSDKKAYLVTADGGLDDEHREDVQEHMHTHLIFSEIVNALHIQAIGGCFVCKIYDINTAVTVQMITLLSYFYKDVYLFKPTSSKPVNSEKYIVCLKFEGIQTSMLAKLLDIKKKWTEIDITGTMGNTECFVSSLFNSTFPMNDIQDFNFLYTTQQLKYVNFSMNAIDFLQNSVFLANNKELQMKYSLEWCATNNINVNNKYTSQWSTRRSNMLFSSTQDTYDNTFAIYTALRNNDENTVYVLTDYSDYSNIQLFVYAFRHRKYNMLPYLCNNIHFSELIYYLSGPEIIEIFMILGYAKSKEIVLPITPLSYRFICRDRNSKLKQFIMKYYQNEMYEHIINLPIMTMKLAVKYEKMYIVNEYIKHPALSINAMKYALNYNNTVDFVTRLHKLVPKYVFTEQDLVKCIKFGNFRLLQYITKTRPFKIFNRTILDYCIYYDYPTHILVLVLKLCKYHQKVNIHQLLKRNKKDLETILIALQEQKYSFRNIYKIHDFFTQHKQNPDSLVLLYKYNILTWSSIDVIYLKDKLPEVYINKIKSFGEDSSTESFNNPFNYLS